MRIKRVAIIGGGIMGADLAATMLQTGKLRGGVIVKELNQKLADKVRHSLDKRIDGWAAAGYVHNPDVMKEALTTTASYDEFGDVDLVVEAIVENVKLKQKVFAELEKMLPDDTIITSNTSAIPIEILSRYMLHPERFAGMHFFNPPTKMPLVELISSDTTSEETVDALEKFSRRTLQKMPIRAKDRPGFLINVLLAGYLAPAIRALEETDISLDAIDEAACTFGWPMGPFALLDRLGVFVVREVMNTMAEAYPNRFTASALIDVMVQKERLGKNAGAGFYNYDSAYSETLSDIRGELFPKRLSGDVDTIFNGMMHMMVNEATIALEDGISSKGDIETGCLFGLGFPGNKEGPLHWADAIGLDTIIDGLNNTACDLLKSMKENDEEFFEDF